MPLESSLLFNAAAVFLSTPLSPLESSLLLSHCGSSDDCMRPDKATCLVLTPGRSPVVRVCRPSLSSESVETEDWRAPTQQAHLSAHSSLLPLPYRRIPSAQWTSPPQAVRTLVETEDPKGVTKGFLPYLAAQKASCLIWQHKRLPASSGSCLDGKASSGSYLA